MAQRQMLQQRAHAKAVATAEQALEIRQPHGHSACVYADVETVFDTVTVERVADNIGSSSNGQLVDAFLRPGQSDGDHRRPVHVCWEVRGGDRFPWYTGRNLVQHQLIVAVGQLASVLLVINDQLGFVVETKDGIVVVGVGNAVASWRDGQLKGARLPWIGDGHTARGYFERTDGGRLVGSFVVDGVCADL